MKKAKMFLTAVAVFSLVGGALAFKAYHGGKAIYTADPNDATKCDVRVSSPTLYTTTSSGGTSYFATTVNGDPCPSTATNWIATDVQ